MRHALKARKNINLEKEVLQKLINYMNSRCVKKWLIFFFMLPIAGFGQLKKYPVFDECEGETHKFGKRLLFIK